MKIQIKITGIEISIDTDEPTSAPAVIETTAQALEAAVSASSRRAVQPLLASQAQPKRKERTTKTTPQPAAAPEPATTPALVGSDFGELSRTAESHRSVEPQPATAIPAVTNAEKTPNTAPTTTNGHDAGAKPQHMDFHEFDTLVRSEIKRLALEPNTLPSHSVWNERRDPALPSWATVLTRYGCASARSLAEKLGMNLAKSGPRPEPAT